MEITAGMVKELRDRTGAGMMQCKKALSEAEGDVEKATQALRKMGLAAAAKRAERATAEGRIEAYVHPGERIGALVEVNCETDFVARTDDFVRFCREVALQVAATSPRFVAPEDVPASVVEERKREAGARLADEGLAGDELAARVEQEVETFLKEEVLLNQPNIRDASRSLGTMLTELAAKLGENVRIRRFSIFRLGDSD
ncbi:MAG: translation elongation factor Ts [Candidatus Eisenbacteria bacterium]|nr:translation elongation factor Ts [Candidatus Latescibacterota bacterium]MBD3303478.1 translation elongation factor Ts [Candidatus Eisenbacteria bacterium]